MENLNIVTLEILVLQSPRWLGLLQNSPWTHWTVQLAIFKGTDDTWAALVCLVHAKQLQTSGEQVCIVCLFNYACKLQPLPLLGTMQMKTSCRTVRILLKHRFSFCLIHTICVWFNCLFKHLSTGLSSHWVGSRTQSGCERMHLQKKPVVLYCMVLKEYNAATCQTATNVSGSNKTEH